RCAMLARMGAIAASYDLFAWGESALQFDSKLHRHSMAHTMQTLNGIRILDYLLSLPKADKNRVGITGGSGGGSQTMLIAAIDDRVTVSIPVVMTSSHFMGGCPCESGKPVHLCGNGTNNAEIAAMFAPRPQLIASDGKDWSSSVPYLELPFIRKIYGFYEKKDLVQNVHFQEEGHDYGTSKRNAVYEFMAQYLQLDINVAKDKAGNIDESTVTIEPFEDLYIFGKDGENLPKNAVRSMDELERIFEGAQK
ncbi:MAG: acetylxylan esterase, partial [Prevotellaceae bacterium]|nr:acetylxylan esterase [Prevotellaceae bacterium]